MESYVILPTHSRNLLSFNVILDIAVKAMLQVGGVCVSEMRWLHFLRGELVWDVIERRDVITIDPRKILSDSRVINMLVRRTLLFSICAHQSKFIVR